MVFLKDEFDRIKSRLEIDLSIQNIYDFFNNNLIFTEGIISKYPILKNIFIGLIRISLSLEMLFKNKVIENSNIQTYLEDLFELETVEGLLIEKFYGIEFLSLFQKVLKLIFLKESQFLIQEIIEEEPTYLRNYYTDIPINLIPIIHLNKNIVVNFEIIQKSIIAILMSYDSYLLTLMKKQNIDNIQDIQILILFFELCFDFFSSGYLSEVNMERIYYILISIINLANNDFMKIDYSKISDFKIIILHLKFLNVFVKLVYFFIKLKIKIIQTICLRDFKEINESQINKTILKLQFDENVNDSFINSKRISKLYSTVIKKKK